MNSNLIEAIQRAAWLHSKIDFDLARAVVKKVDEDALTAQVVVTGENAPVYTATLHAVRSSDIAIIPTIDSIVIIGYVHKSPNQAVILQYSTIDKIIIKPVKEYTIQCGNATLGIQPSGIELTTAQGKLKITDGVSIGNGTQPLVLGTSLQTWAMQVDSALAAIIAWGAGVTPPLTGAIPSLWNSAILSLTNKVS